MVNIVNFSIHNSFFVNVFITSSDYCLFTALLRALIFC